jgi:hypothetical protein
MVEPSRRREKDAAVVNKLAAKYIAQGMSKAEAREKAYKEARSGPRRDVRRLKKK